MPSSDHILSFLLATLIHAIGLLLVGQWGSRLAPPEASAPELAVASLELTFSEAGEARPAAAAAAAEPLRTLSLPPPAEPSPALELPDKPSFADALAPAPEKTAEPSPQPSPQPSPEPAPAAPPAAAAEPEVVMGAPAGTAEQTTIEPSGGSSGRVDAHPSLDRPIKPAYPFRARRRGEEGTVILDVEVAVDGSVSRVTTVSGSGSADLDAAAEHAAELARFKPATRDGAAVPAAARLTIVFRLRDR